MALPRSASSAPSRRGWRFAALVLLLALAGAFGLSLAPTRTRAIDKALPAAGTPEMAQLIDAGRYVAITADCAACHTAPGAGHAPFAGGLPMATPIGTIYSSNITPDKGSGIGSYSLDDFDRAVRHGITPAGGTLYPAMPYPSYARLTDEDTRALYAYFLHGVPAVAAANRGSDIAWPLSMRWPLALWRRSFAPTSDAAPIGVDVARYGDASVARGAYLAQAAGHCGSCHTARAFTLQEKALDESSALYLAGGQVIDGWLAVNLRGDDADGLGRWSAQDIVDTLKTGRNAHAAVIGSPMSDVITHSTQHFSEADLQALAAYLKTLKPAGHEAARFSADERSTTALRSGREGSRGGELYLDNCAGCHRSDGRGNALAFPAMAGNPSVLAADPSSLIRLLLAGSAMPPTQTRPSALGMPGFAERLSDEESAQLLSFVRQAWGNQAGSVSVAQVAAVRRQWRSQPQQAGELRQDGQTAAQPSKH